MTQRTNHSETWVSMALMLAIVFVLVVLVGSCQVPMRNY